MKRATHILLLGFLCGLTAWLGEGIASAQIRYNPYTAYAQNQAMQQNLYTQQVIANQAGRVYGANYGIPFYASTVSNFYGTPNYYTPYYPPAYTAPAYSGNYVNPYSPAAPGYGVNPYSPVDPNVANPYSPYSPYNSSYGAGSALMGQADVMRAYGQQVNAIEAAYIVREKAKQARIETKKMQFEYEMWVKANTPTYTQEQERIGKETLRRIQKNSTSGEVSGGKALNYLIDDLRKYPKALKDDTSLEAINLSDDVLNHLNVTSKTYGVGLLRDSGNVKVPVAFRDAKDRKELERNLQSLYKAASNNENFGNVLTDVRTTIDRMREDLVKRVNDTPDGQYFDAKQFLQELREATVGIEGGQLAVHTKYQKWVEEGKGGRTVKELAKYMVDNGLRIGPATANDEAAYRAIHSALASFDIAMNSQYGEAGKE